MCQGGGGVADQLASQIIKTVKKAYEYSEGFLLEQAWQGRNCDEQYQAQAFKQTLFERVKLTN